MEIQNYMFSEQPLEQAEMVGPEPGENSGIAKLIMDGIKDEYEAIQFYNDFVCSLNASSLENKDAMIKIINDIATEENVHVGQLEQMLNSISPNASKIEDGKQEASEELDDDCDCICCNNCINSHDAIEQLLL